MPHIVLNCNVVASGAIQPAAKAHGILHRVAADVGLPAASVGPR